MSVSDQALAKAAALPNPKVAVVHPTNPGVLDAVVVAQKADLIDPIFIGPAAKIREAMIASGIDELPGELIDVEHSHEAAEMGAAMAAAGTVECLMKGSLHTAELLQAVLAEKSLRTERRLSHVYLFELTQYHKPLMVTDGGVNIAPTLTQKADIAQNAANLFKALTGGERPAKIAALAAVETVEPDMPATIDAAALNVMGDRGQITDAIIDGPLAFDNAISKEAAEIKGIESEVAGDPDILLVPDLEAGNMIAKQFTFLCGADAAGIVLGARVPIILPSRADSERVRLLSCAVAVNLVEARKKGVIK